MLHSSLLYLYPNRQDDGGIEFYNTIVLQPHLKLVTELGRGYHVRCRYKSREAAAAPKQIAANDGVPDALVADDTRIDRREHGRSLGGHSHVETNEIPLPGCHMRIHKTTIDGEKTDDLKIVVGDMLIMEISIDDQDVYGMHVSDCNVHDGLESPAQNLFQFG